DGHERGRPAPGADATSGRVAGGGCSAARGTARGKIVRAERVPRPCAGVKCGGKGTCNNKSDGKDSGIKFRNRYFIRCGQVYDSHSTGWRVPPRTGDSDT